MLTKDLIALLQAKLDTDKEHEHIMGVSTIEIDTFSWNKDKEAFDYRGITGDVRITRTPDGVYDVLTAIEDK